MRRRALAALALALAALLPLPGCAALRSLWGEPSAHLAKASLRVVELQGAELVFDVAVSNPHAVDLPVLAADCELRSGSLGLVQGRGNVAGGIPARGSRTLPVAVRVDFASLLALAPELRPGTVVEYVAHLGVVVRAPDGGQLRLELRHAGSFPVPAEPEIALQSVRWEKLELNEALGELEVGVRNANTFVVNLSHMDYELQLGGTPVASGSAHQILKLKAGEAGSLRLPLSLRAADLGLAAPDALAGSTAPYDLRGRVTLDSVFGPLDLPFSRQGRVPVTRSR